VTDIELSTLGSPNHPVQIVAPNEPDGSSALSDEAPNDSVEAIPDGGYGWTIVGSCFVLSFWINGFTTSWGILQTAIVKSPELRADLRAITFVGSLCMACTVAFGLASVRIMRSLGIWVTGLIAITLFGLGLVVTSFTLEHLAGLFCVAGVLVGSGMSILFTATNSLPVQWFSGKLGLANGIVKAGGGLGATVLPLAAQALIDRTGLQWTFRIFGFLVLATGIPSVLLLKERGSAAAASRFDWSLLKNIPFLAVTMAGAATVFALMVPPFFLPLFASSIGLSTSIAAGLVAGFGGSTTVGRLLGGWLADRIGAFNALAISEFIYSLTMFAIWPVSSSIVPLFIFAILNGCANGGAFVGLPTAVAALAPGSAAASISLMTFFWTPGYLLGTPLAGILIEATGADEAASIGPYRAAIFYGAGVGGLAFLLALVSRMNLSSKIWKKL
jgi:MFS family permease